MPRIFTLRRHMTGEYLEAFGDIARLPLEMRRAAKPSPGRGADRTARAQSRTGHIAHDSGAST
jgi:hypothetical protein